MKLRRDTNRKRLVFATVFFENVWCVSLFAFLLSLRCWRLRHTRDLSAQGVGMFAFSSLGHTLLSGPLDL